MPAGEAPSTGAPALSDLAPMLPLDPDPRPDDRAPHPALPVSERLRLELAMLEGEGATLPDAAGEAGRPHRPTLLVASEHPDLRAYVRVCMQPLALRVVEAGDGAAVRAQLRAGAVDLVLADVALPGLDALALAHLLRSGDAGRSAGLLLMTDDPSPAVHACARAAGAGLLALPFNAATLRAWVRAILT